MAEKVNIELEIKDNVKSLKAQLREAQNEVTQLSEKFGATSKEAVQAAKRAAALNNSYDLYDIILSHLLDEGYADTQEAALAIMGNMSEEWSQSIISEGPNYDKNRQRAAKRAEKKAKTPEEIEAEIAKVEAIVGPLRGLGDTPPTSILRRNFRHHPLRRSMSCLRRGHRPR